MEVGYQNDFEIYIVAFNLSTVHLISNAIAPAIIRSRLIQGVPGGMGQTSGECSLC